MRCSRYRPISEGATGQAAYLSRGFSNPRGSFSVTCPTSIIQGAKGFQNEAPIAGRRAARPSRLGRPLLLQFEEALCVSWLSKLRLQSHPCKACMHEVNTPLYAIPRRPGGWFITRDLSASTFYALVFFLEYPTALFR